MVNYLHYTVKAGPANTVVITLNKPASVKLLDTLEYYKYKLGKRCKPVMEYACTPSFNMKVPHKSEWHVIIENAEEHGFIKAIVDVV
jgi:hypothetical protein